MTPLPGELGCIPGKQRRLVLRSLMVCHRNQHHHTSLDKKGQLQYLRRRALRAGLTLYLEGLSRASRISSSLIRDKYSLTWSRPVECRNGSIHYKSPPWLEPRYRSPHAFFALGVILHSSGGDRVPWFASILSLGPAVCRPSHVGAFPLLRAYQSGYIPRIPNP